MPRMLSQLTLLLYCAVLVTAQSIAPANGTSPKLPRNREAQIGLQVSRADGLPTPATPTLIPLIDGASDKLPNDGRSGTFFAATPDNVANISVTNIAWISCDSSDYPGNLDAVDVLQRAVDKPVAAAILYSKTSSHCNLTWSDDLPSSLFYYIYSTSSARDSMGITTMMTYNPDSVPMRATINLVQRLASNSSSGNGGSAQQQQPGGPSPSTAVAMIILYSITGVITALFLIIIITGAVRAHRHPERYGPRAVLGRARQSRAKGIARAMLDSIPIVKFGDNEADVPKPRDVELAEANRRTEPRAEGQPEEGDGHGTTTETAQRRSSDDGPAQRTVSRDSEGGIGAGFAPPSQHSHPPEQALGCSICTEDFERGEDVRVLPCNHKFHPACIDPWLLNVSGTCPLCRIDLRPPTSHDPNDPNQPENDDPDSASANRSLSQGSAENVATGDSPGSSNNNLRPDDASRRQSRRLSSFLFDPLNRRRMEDATPEERIQALRQYNARNRDRSAGGDAESRRRRISARLSNAFGGGMRRTDESSEEPSRAVTPLNTTPEVAPHVEVSPVSPMSPTIRIDEPVDRLGSAGPSDRR